jgi:hypothetical protein
MLLNFLMIVFGLTLCLSICMAACKPVPRDNPYWI